MSKSQLFSGKCCVVSEPICNSGIFRKITEFYQSFTHLFLPTFQPKFGSPVSTQASGLNFDIILKSRSSFHPLHPIYTLITLHNISLFIPAVLVQVHIAYMGGFKDFLTGIEVSTLFLPSPIYLLHLCKNNLPKIYFEHVIFLAHNPSVVF